MNAPAELELQYLIDPSSGNKGAHPLVAPPSQLEVLS
jgi:hypothetical protein